jgi:hypothetical protein
MAIKGAKKGEVVSVYDPKVQAYHEVTIAELTKQLEGLGFEKAAIDERIGALKAASTAGEEA